MRTEEKYSSDKKKMAVFNRKTANIIILWAVYVLDLVSRSEAANGSIKTLFAFGDSILDTGNNNNLNTASKCNFPPYGRDFPGGFPTGRFCDGKVFSDLIAEGVGVKATLPAHLDPKLQPSDLPSGVCFASGGSGLDSLTATMQNVLTVSDQVNLFKEYISKLKTQVGEKRANAIVSNAFYLISFGNNDIALTYYAARRRPQYDIASYTSLLVNYASDFVKEIYGLGARRIGFMSALPLGCLPGGRITGGILCNEIVNQAAQMFNSKLSKQLASIKTSLPQSNIVFLDVYNPLLDLVRNPQKSGFTVANVGCCIGLVSCPVPSSYVFWDIAHPTERSYRIIVNQTLAKYSTFFS